jgi:GNAT superfamily N-acetyltransferase
LARATPRTLAKGFILAAKASQLYEIPTSTPELHLVREVARIIRRGPYTVLQVEAPGEKFGPDVRPTLMKMIERESVPLLEGVDIRASYWRPRADYFDQIDEWAVVEHEGRLIGWCGVCRWKTDCGPILYYDTLGVMPGHRRVGIGALLAMDAWFRYWRFPRKLPRWTLRTQSPVVYALFRRLIQMAAFPKLKEPLRDLPPYAVEVLSAVVERTSPGKDFDRRTGVVYGAVGAGDLYDDDLPSLGDDFVDEFFKTRLNLAAGDALIGVGVPHLRAYVPQWIWTIALYVYFRIRVAVSRPKPRSSPIESSPTEPQSSPDPVER